MTIRGVGGTGKSKLIHFLVNAIRRKCGAYDCVQIIAPTGSAANNVNGKTIHNRFGIPVNEKEPKISSTTQTRQLKKNSRLLVVILDERSMVSSILINSLEHYISQTIFNGQL